MRRWMVIWLLALAWVLPLGAQRVKVTVQSEELSSGQYNKGFIDIGYVSSSQLSVRAFVNGRPQEVGEAKGVRPGSRKVRISGLPEVEYEKCRVKLEFLDSGNRVVDTKEFVLQYKDPRKNLYMLSIGVGGNLQDSSFLPLTFPKYDATNVRDCFRDYSKAYYIEKEFRLLCDPSETTTVSIRRKLDQVANEIQADDVFMLYLSGHGEEEGGEFYFVTYDTRQKNLKTTALSGAEIRGILHRMTAKKAQVYVFVDACHAESLYLKDAQAQGIVYYASCQKDEMSAESRKWKNSVYANALIAALKGTDGSAQIGDGYITVASLQDCLYSKVRRETGFSQNPACHHPGFGEDHVIFKSAVAADAPSQQGAQQASASVSKPAAQSVPVLADVAAAYAQALKYQNGEGVSIDLVRAFELMKSAAEKGYVPAYHPLADMYHGGRGVKKDRSKAEYWYQKAADAGDKKARQKLFNM